MSVEKLALIMAAGEGTRMLSNLPKVLHAVCGQPIVEHVLRAVDSVCKQKVLIVGHGKERIMEACHGQAILWSNSRVDGARVMPFARLPLCWKAKRARC